MKKRGSRPNNFLDFIPRRNVEHETLDDGRVVLLRPKWVKGLLAKWLQPRLRHKFFRVSLDELGTAVWNAADGQRTVKDICDELFEIFGEEVEPRYERGALFIRSLADGALVTLEQKPHGEGREDAPWNPANDADKS